MVETKTVSIDKEVAFVVITLPDEVEWTEAGAKAMKRDMEEIFPGVKCLVLPHGCEVTAVPVGPHSYHRESFEGYELEIVCRDEEGIRARIEMLNRVAAGAVSNYDRRHEMN